MRYLYHKLLQNLKKSYLIFSIPHQTNGSACRRTRANGGAPDRGTRRIGSSQYSRSTRTMPPSPRSSAWARKAGKRSMGCCHLSKDARPWSPTTARRTRVSLGTMGSSTSRRRLRGLSNGIGESPNEVNGLMPEFETWFALQGSLDEASAGLPRPIPFPKGAFLRQGDAQQAGRRTVLGPGGEVGDPLPRRVKEGDAHRPVLGIRGMALRDLRGRPPHQ